MKRIFLSSGGTKVKIDRVRHVGNMSHGTFGSLIARELLKLIAAGEDVSLKFLYADRSLAPLSVSYDFSKFSIKDIFKKLYQCFQLCRLRSRTWNKYTQIVYKDFYDYKELLEEEVRSNKPDVVILAAAVSDYLVAHYVDGKIRSNEDLNISLCPAPKLIREIKNWHPDCRLVGFKLLVDSTDDQLIAASKDSIEKNGCDLVVANDLRDIVNNQHRLLLVSKDKVECVQHDPNDAGYLAKVVANKAWGLL